MEIVVEETYAHMLEDENLIQNVETLYIMEFPFDKSWDDYTKATIFKADSMELSVKLTDDRYITPAKCLKWAGVSLRIGVSGIEGEEQKGTVWHLTSRAVYAIDAAQLVPPSHSRTDIRAQVLEVIWRNTATDEEVDAALDDMFTSGWTSLDDLEHPGNTATDEEVEDALDDIFGDKP